MRRIKSICGKYTLVYTRHVSDGEIIDRRGTRYVRAVKEGKNGAFYSSSHAMTGYSAYAKGLDSRKFFTMRFADCKNGVRIVPFKGNTIIKEHEAVFRVQKPKSIKQ